MKAGSSVVVFGTRESGHTRRLLPVISGLARAGVRVHVFGMHCYRADIEDAGGDFVDLYRGRALDDADASSVPIPCRYVSFAGRYAGEILSEAAALKPSLVLHDSFSVIGGVVAKRLGVPRVNVCAGHNYPPEAALKALQTDPRVSISEDCRRAVKTLREKYGMPDASPFAYATNMSSDLNLYCEPPQYLPEDQRGPFQPVAFVGSLSEQTLHRPAPTTSPYGGDAAGRVRIYISLGTVIWRYYESAALGVLEAVREAVARRPEFTALVSLGGMEPAHGIRHLESPDFRLERYVHQWDVLGCSSVFLTHHGLNSTHEAIFQRVPMISYPFFHDQPGMAKFSQDLGLAVPLAAELRGRVSSDDILTALSRVENRRDSMTARMEEAREWELDVMAGRGGVIRRILDLA